MCNKDRIETKVLDYFNYLHIHPEVSWKEFNTTNYIKDILIKNGCSVRIFNDCTGVIGKFGDFNKGLPVLAIRADMDALWQELNGEYQAIHSCAHDAHMSIGLGVLLMLSKTPELKDKVAIKFIFQPAEEVGTGALKMIKKNVLEDVDYLFGIHLRPSQEMDFGYASPFINHGATRSLFFEIVGDDAHGARPELNNNAIEIGSEIISEISDIKINTHIPYSAKVTKFHAGSNSVNIIPGNGDFAIDLRAQNNEVMTQLNTEVNNITSKIKSKYQAEINITENTGIVAAIKNEEAIRIAMKAIENHLGEDKLIKELITPGSDDFHYYTFKNPTLKATMIGLGSDLSPGLHHPEMTFNKNAIMKGVSILYNVIIQIYQIKK